jgi:protease-4
MQFSLFKEIFGSPWQIESGTFQRYFPLAVSILNGGHLVVEPEPHENQPYKVVVKNSDTNNVSFDEIGFDEEPLDTDEEAVEGPVISVIPVRGIMMKHDMACGPRGTRSLGNRLRNADADDRVIGHILIFETGGGSANSVPELSDAITACKKPVVAWVDGMMCSAGQFAGSYCREIIASRTDDWVGSIGTMLVWEGRKAKSAENTEGVVHVRIYADGAEEKNDEYEFAINDQNFKIAKERILNPHNQKFISEIKNNRPGVEDKHLHGKMFYAGEVIGSLVDSIGNFDYAIERVIALSGFVPGVQTSGNESVADNNSNINNDSQKSEIMSFKHIGGVLGEDSLEFEADGRRTFTSDEMAAIEKALAANSGEELQAALDAERQTVASLQNDVSENTRLLEEANQQIASLQNENATLRQKPAAAPAAAPTQNDPPAPVSKQGKAIADNYENPMDAIHEISRVYLNREI